VGDNPMDMGSRRLLSWCVSLEISANFREELPGPRIRWWVIVLAAGEIIRTYIFHLHIVSHTSNFDEESLEVDGDFFFDLFSKLSAEHKLVTDVRSWN
jgi:hypothetical protein